MILGCCIFYNDGPELLENCLKSLKTVTDRVLAIDGAYEEFPHTDFRSNAETLKVAQAYADNVIYANRPWKDEVEKRNAYLVLKSQKDYYFMLDADEVVEGEKPANLTHATYRISLSTFKDGIWLPCYYNRLFRHHKGMRYHLKHNNLITKTGLSLSLPEDNIPIYRGLTIRHFPDSRPRARQEQDGIFETTKAEGKIELPPNQKTPVSDMAETPIRLRYNGEGIYRGFDGSTANAILCNPGDLVYVSKRKAAQLQTDFPNDWIFIKDLEA